MCGIAGYTGRAVRGRLAAISAGLRHRGPDAEGIYEGQGYHLCNRLLAIVAPQLHPPYDPAVSILDLLLMTGPAARAHICAGR